MHSYKIAITGASGYIGSKLIDCLVVNGHKPIALSRKDLSSHSLSGLGSALKDVDIIFHLAGLKGYDINGADIDKVVEANINLTDRIVKVAKKNNIKIIFTSTYWVYGHKAHLPYHEDSVLTPSEPYGWSKALAEKLITSSGVDYNIIRLANVFGYGMGRGYEEVTAVFLQRALQGKEILLKNNGKHSIDLICIDDVCKVMLDLLKTNEKQLIINVGSGAPVTILKLAEIANLTSKKTTGKQAVIKKEGTEKDEILFADRYMDIAKFKQLIDFTTTPLDSALETFATKLLNE